METKDAVEALKAMAQESRIAIFKLLVKYCSTGLPAGKIAEELGIPGPTLSFHLAQMERAGLLCVRRCGRSLLYAIHFQGMRDLLLFLLQDCCAGRHEFQIESVLGETPHGALPIEKESRSCCGS